MSIGDPLGVHWGIFRVPVDPFAYPLDPFGVTVAVFAPLGTILDDFCIMLGPSDYKKGPEGDEFKMLGPFLLVFGYIL